jgi:hypothetical protein
MKCFVLPIVWRLLLCGTSWILISSALRADTTMVTAQAVVTTNLAGQGAVVLDSDNQTGSLLADTRQVEGIVTFAPLFPDIVEATGHANAHAAGPNLQVYADANAVPSYILAQASSSFQGDPIFLFSGATPAAFKPITYVFQAKGDLSISAANPLAISIGSGAFFNMETNVETVYFSVPTSTPSLAASAHGDSLIFVKGITPDPHASSATDHFSVSASAEAGGFDQIGPLANNEVFVNGSIQLVSILIQDDGGNPIPDVTVTGFIPPNVINAPIPVVPEPSGIELATLGAIAFAITSVLCRS